MRKNTTAALMIVMLASVTSHAQAPRDWDAIEKRSLQLLVDGKGEEAIVLLEKVVAASPDFASAHSMLGDTHGAVAATIDTGSPAQAAKRRRHLESAASHYRRAVDLTHVNRAMNLVSLAEIYGPEALNQPRDAELFARRLVAEHPSISVGHASLAGALVDTNRGDAAAAVLRQSRTALDDAGRLRLGAALWDHAKRMKPDARAGVRVLLDEALIIADEAIKTTPDKGQVFMLKSVVLELQAERLEDNAARKKALVDESRRLWEKGRDLNNAGSPAEATPPPGPQYPEGWFEAQAKAQQLSAEGKRAEALAVYERYARAHPEFALVHGALAYLHQTMADAITAREAKAVAERTRHFSTAVDEYRKAMALAPADPAMPADVWGLLELFGAERLNRPAEADALVRDAVSKYPADPASHAAAVKVAAASGRAADIDSILEKARSSVPATFESRHRMAVSLWDIVNRDPKIPADIGRRLLTEGIAAADEALTLKPDFLDAVVYKSLLLRLQATRYEPDAGRAKALIEEADRLRARALEIQKSKK